MRLLNYRGHHKEKDEAVGSGDDRVVIAPDKWEVTLHAARDAIGAKEAKSPERTKEAQAVPADRSQE